MPLDIPNVVERDFKRLGIIEVYHIENQNDQFRDKGFYGNYLVILINNQFTQFQLVSKNPIQDIIELMS